MFLAEGGLIEGQSLVVGLVKYYVVSALLATHGSGSPPRGKIEDYPLVYL